MVECLVQRKAGGLRCEAAEVVPVRAGHSGGGRSRVPKEAGVAKARHSHLVGRSCHPNGACNNQRLIREVVVENKNASEKVFRTTRQVRCYPLQRGGPGSDTEAQCSLERGYESAFDENASRGPRADGSRRLVSIRHEPRMAQGLLPASRRPKRRLLHREHPRRPLGRHSDQGHPTADTHSGGPCSSDVERAASP